MRSSLLILYVLAAGGCASDPVMGTWVIDIEHSHTFSFPTTRPSESSQRIEAKHQSALVGTEYIFHRNREGNPWSGQFDGLVEIRKDGQTMGFAGWKAEPIGKAAAKKPDVVRAYDIFEYENGNTFVFQGPFVVKGKRAEWHPQLGNLGGAVLVFRRK